MIPSGVEIFFVAGAIDLRWGFNRLTGVVTEQLGRNVRGGALFLFMGKRRDALKVLFFDGSGMCLFYKRLDRGLFRLPSRAEGNDSESIEIDESALNEILDGIDLEPTASKKTERKKKKKKETIH